MTTSQYKKPLPSPQPESDRYWEGARNGELWLRRCLDCKRAYFYPRNICPLCGSANTEWSRASGRATLYTFAIAHRAPHPGFEGDVPFITAIVELEEGPRMATNIVGVTPDPAKLKLGMPLRVVFEKATEQVTLPKFTPA